MSALQRDFGGVLVRRQLLSMSQLSEARRIEWKHRRDLGEVLLDLGYVSLEDIADARAELAGIRPLDLDHLAAPRAALELVPETLGREFTILPLGFDRSRRLEIAFPYPIDPQHVRLVESRVKRSVAAVPCWRVQIVDAIERLYGPSTKVEATLAARFAEIRRLQQLSDPNHASDLLARLGHAGLDEARAEQAVLTFFDLDGVRVPPAIIELLPESVARENLVLPVGLEGDGRLQVAMGCPLDLDVVQKLEFILNKTVVVVLARRQQLIDAIDCHYGDTQSESVDSMLQEFTDTAIDFTELGELSSRKDDFESPSAPPRVKGEVMGSASIALEAADTDLDASDFDFSQDESANASEVVALSDEEAEFELSLDADDAVLSDTMTGSCDLMDMPQKPMARRMACFKNGLLGLEAGVAEKQAAIRYYHQMNPERMFPLVVQLSSRVLRKIVGEHVRQDVSKRFEAQLDAPVEVEPVLPGCYCYPPRAQLDPKKRDAETTFWVVPHVLGKLMGPRVVIRQGDKVLAEVPLEIHVVKQNVTVFVGALSFMLPFLSAFRNYDDATGRGLVRQWLDWLLSSITPEMLMFGLFATTLALYLWLRPRKMQVSCDLEPAR